jgi:hypothetical protein
MGDTERPHVNSCVEFSEHPGKHRARNPSERIRVGLSGRPRGNQRHRGTGGRGIFLNAKRVDSKEENDRNAGRSSRRAKFGVRNGTFDLKEWYMYPSICPLVLAKAESEDIQSVSP